MNRCNVGTEIIPHNYLKLISWIFEPDSAYLELITSWTDLSLYVLFYCCCVALESASKQPAHSKQGCLPACWDLFCTCSWQAALGLSADGGRVSVHTQGISLPSVSKWSIGWLRLIFSIYIFLFSSAAFHLFMLGKRQLILWKLKYWTLYLFIPPAI